MQFEYSDFRREIIRLQMENSGLRMQVSLHKFIQALKYREDQRRIPAGMPGGGRWTSEGGGAREEEPAKDPPIRIAAPKGGGLPRVIWHLTVRQFVSRYCKGTINRELPGQFEDVTIADILKLKRGGDDAAKTCYKILNEGRFRK